MSKIDFSDALSDDQDSRKSFDWSFAPIIVLFKCFGMKLDVRNNNLVCFSIWWFTSAYGFIVLFCTSTFSLKISYKTIMPIYPDVSYYLQTKRCVSTTNHNYLMIV